MSRIAIACLGLAVSASPLAAQIRPDSASLPERQRIYSPYVERTERDKNFAEGLYWGDTHLHTSYSTDAGMIGNTLPRRLRTASPVARRSSPARGSVRA